jgi:hypothetical protein
VGRALGSSNLHADANDATGDEHAHDGQATDASL